VLRYPKGPLPPALPAIDQVDGVDVLARHDGDSRSVLVVGVGPMAHTAVRVAELLAAEGCSATAVDPRWVLPVPEALVKVVGEHVCAVVIEDGVTEGGIGALLAQHCVAAGVRTPVHPIGIPLGFLVHASRAEHVERLRLRAEDIAHDVLRRLDAR
jgi:1-deoxy-D-xylulose-5-phosphate synthase